MIHPSDCIVAVNNKDINTREREPGDIDTSRVAARGDDRNRHTMPGQRQRDPDRASRPS